ncbi:MAG: hypothetical protein N3E42_02330 [Candidatus Bipolaricaulota bacterium]|nr:hypothetical protein [Candidatus Bipolaricaulota bacterium]
MIAALEIALLGMGMVFGVLGILLGVMIVLERWTQPKGGAKDE